MNLPLVGNLQIKEKVQGTAPLSHAYLIAGETGSGRGVLAKYMGQKALCTQETDKPCGICSGCHKVANNIHPDFQIHGNPEGKPLSVEQVRAIHSDVTRRPNEGAHKVYVILQGDQLNGSGQNALLKLLEEPPPYAMFFLITGESAGVLETIRSRCQLLRLQPVSLEQARTWLSYRYPEEINLPAERMGGYLGRAQQIWGVSPLSDRKKQEDDEEYLRENFQKLQGRRPPKAKVKLTREDSGQEQQVDLQAAGLVSALVQQDEFALMSLCVSLEKLDKSLVPYFLDQIRYHLIQYRKQGWGGKTDAALLALEEISTASTFHVSLPQILAWFTAEIYNRTSKGTP